ncbi:YcgN family cysteine cluster protein [Pseudaquidulcibacter saccharophilus]|uniref:YcgN family cysteine cluster protein n=1 Tax=Pseudaquidulcibacter saccharophilus TaxID=2831900 RepID=UPI001EFF4912|nr:YcgN family cysteine cluster protein [Pseudaquidulcibacter saccharophilus]
MIRNNFWRETSIQEWNDEEWESLCDNCGKCCLIRLEDEDNGDIYNTDVHCKLFDNKSCRCSDYDNRVKYVPDCVKLDKENVFNLSWLPQTCAYRLIAEGKPLFDWHYLIAGNHDLMHDNGYSVKEKTVNETRVKTKYLIKHIKHWKGEER